MPHYKHYRFGEYSSVDRVFVSNARSPGFKPQYHINWTWGHISVTPALQRKREAEEFEVQGHTWFRSQFKASLAYMKPCLKNIKLWLVLLCE